MVWVGPVAMRLMPLVFLVSFAQYARGYDGWANLQGANYVPSYSKHDVHDIFRSATWDATVVDRELGYAKNLKVVYMHCLISTQINLQSYFCA